MTQREYNECKAELQRLQEKLDKAVIEKTFEAKGQFFLDENGKIDVNDGTNNLTKAHYNYWETKKQAEQASVYQYNHNLIMNYVMQFDGKIGKGMYYIYRSSKGEWNFSFTSSCYYPEAMTMTEDCAIALIQDINDNIVVFKEVK